METKTENHRDGSHLKRNDPEAGLDERRAAQAVSVVHQFNLEKPQKSLHWLEALGGSESATALHAGSPLSPPEKQHGTDDVEAASRFQLNAAQKNKDLRHSTEYRQAILLEL
ncbi:GL18759 [Drosophila persimilis]|uniref:GL18759 n=1 Tax=Drosophila persimilis TaxID=7234 RepID=B4G8V9_DROPE|nr:GL18759 [Drosophila persimilis]